MLRISVINESTVFADDSVKELIRVFERQWNVDLRKAWGVDKAHFTFVRHRRQPDPSSWWIAFLDDSDQAHDLSYHDLTNHGCPIAKVFIKTIRHQKSVVSVAATHEMCEMAVDPWVNTAYQDRNGVFWAGEICDPVEGPQYGYKIDGVLATDFVTPDWFGFQHRHGRIDHAGHATEPFEVLSGGYAQKYNPRKGWQQVTGAAAKRSKRAMQPADGSRRERRIRGMRAKAHCSERAWER